MPNPLIAPAKPILLTVDILVQCGADRASVGKFIDPLNELLPLYGLNTLLRLSNFFGELMVESACMKAVREYASGAEYEGNVVSLGNTEKGDGIRFAGRGLIQVTGRRNYTAFAKKFGIDCVNHPELLEEPRWAVASALWYWQSKNLNAWADKNNTLAIGCLINIGHIPKPGEKRQFPNDWDKRQSYTAKAKVALAPLFA